MNRGMHQLAVTVLCLSLPFGAAASTMQQWEFAVYLDDKPIGTHRFNVVPQGDSTHVTIAASFDVRFLFFTAYRYRHESNEVWQGNCLTAIDSRTDDNGEQLSVAGRQQDATLLVQAATGSYRIDGCVRSFSYWDPRILNASQLLNAQTGELQTVEVEPLGRELITVRELPQAADRYQIKVDGLVIDLWYSLGQEWLALESTTRSGRRLRYQLN